MDAIKIPSSVPAELKAADLVLKRANELKAHDPVIAYWCCYRAAQIGVADKRTQEGTLVLLDLLDALEKMKELLKENDAVTNEVAGQAYVENFALKVFGGADDEDREGKATPATIRKFLAAATFIEVAKSFGEGELDPDLEAKLKYSRFKAASLSKSFKAGETPTPGPAVQPSPIFPDLALPTPPSGGADDEKAWSHVATPGAVEVEHSAEPDAFSTPSSPTLPSFPATPSANAGDVPSAPTFDRSPSPSPSPDLPSAPPTQPISPDRPHAVQISPLPPSDLSAPPQPPSFPAPSPPPAPPPLAPPAPAKVPPPPAAAAPPPASVPSSSSQAPIDLPQAQIDKIQKHAKWAISALNYEDLDTARKELREALRLLG